MYPPIFSLLISTFHLFSTSHASSPYFSLFQIKHYTSMACDKLGQWSSSCIYTHVYTCVFSMKLEWNTPHRKLIISTITSLSGIKS